MGSVCQCFHVDRRLLPCGLLLPSWRCCPYASCIRVVPSQFSVTELRSKKAAQHNQQLWFQGTTSEQKVWLPFLSWMNSRRDTHRIVFRWPPEKFVRGQPAVTGSSSWERCAGTAIPAAYQRCDCLHLLETLGHALCCVSLKPLLPGHCIN